MPGRSDSWPLHLGPILLLASLGCAEPPTDEPLPDPWIGRGAFAISGAEERTHEVAVESGVWRLDVVQYAVDLRVRVEGPAEPPEVTIDNPIERRGTERAILRVDDPAAFTVSVAVTSRQATTGSYDLSVERMPTTTRAERRRLEAEEAMFSASRRTAEGNREAREAALADYEVALEAFRSLGDSRDVARALTSAAIVHRLLGHLEEAEAAFEEALELWRELGDRDMQSLVLNDLGLTYTDLGRDGDLARGHFERALAIQKQLGNRYGQTVAGSNLCFLLLKRSHLAEARACYLDVLEIQRAAGLLVGQAHTLQNIGGTYFEQGEPHLALRNFELALEVMRSVGDPAGEANALNNLALVHRNLGEYQEALDYYQEALALFRELGDQRRVARTLNNIGFAYHGLGDLARARAFYEEALPKRREAGDRRGEAITLKNIGNVLRESGAVDEARASHEAALALAQEVGDRRLQAGLLQQLGQDERASNRHSRALAFAERARARAGEVGDKNSLVEAVLLQAAVETDAGRPEGALEILTALEPGESPPIPRMRLLTEQARALAAAARPAQAAETAERAIVVLEQLRGAIASPELRASFLGSRRDAFEIAVDAYMEMHSADPAAGHAARAFETSERARARSLLDSLALAGVTRFDALAPELADRHASLIRKLRSQVLEGGDYYSTLAELEEVEREIRPRTASLESPLPGGIEAIQSLLAPGELLVEYALGSKRSFVWLVSSRSMASYELASRESIERLAFEYYGLLRTRRSAVEEVKRVGCQLGEALIAPIREEIDGRKLIVAAEGALHYVPFSAIRLCESRSGAGDWLIRHHEVSRVPSASVLLALRGRQSLPATGRIAVLADPVFDSSDRRIDPTARAEAEREGEARQSGLASAGALGRLNWSRREALAIAELAPPANLLMALDFDASRRTLMTLRGFDIVHLATHGLFDQVRPELTGLVLSRVDPEGRRVEGVVTLRDLFGLQLDARLVVLSGCETALGKRLRGEGLVSLSHGLFQTGARRIVASLWAIEDRASAELMGLFYRSLLVEGRGPAASLRSAQLSLLAGERWRHPFYWAPFVLLGG